VRKPKPPKRREFVAAPTANHDDRGRAASLIATGDVIAVPYTTVSNTRSTVECPAAYPKRKGVAAQSGWWKQIGDTATGIDMADRGVAR